MLKKELQKGVKQGGQISAFAFDELRKDKQTVFESVKQEANSVRSAASSNKMKKKD